MGTSPVCQMEPHMSQNLDAALAFLEKFPQAKLFPAVWGWSEKQKCMTHCPLVAWSVKSSSDPEQIRSWLNGRQKRYACVALAQSDMSVLDVDIKNGKRGDITLMSLELDHGDLPETMLSGTPSAGFHNLFTGRCSQGANKLGPGLDMAVMVPVPGSHAVGKGEYPIIRNGIVAPLPPWIRKMAGEKKEKVKDAPGVDTDLEHNIERAISYLQNAPEAIEGSGGDAVAYAVACKVREFGISESTAIELVHEYYADRCSPYNADWMEDKVANAYRYATKPLGAATAEAAFADVPESMEEDGILPPVKEKPKFTRLNREQILDLPDMDWVVKGVLPSRGISSITGQSTAGKSFLAFDMACHIGYGDPWFGRKVKPRKVVYVCLEGEAGFKHRVEAWEMHHGRPIPPGLDMIKDAFRIMDPDHVEALADEIPEGAVVIVDTLNRSAPDAEENTSKDMGRIISGCAELERRTKGPIILVSHEGKESSKGIRGHSSLFAALDGVLTVKHNGDAREWTISKCKDGMSGVTYSCELRTVEIRKDADGDAITSCVIVPTDKPTKTRPALNDSEQIGMDTYHAAWADDVLHVEVEAWRKEFYKKHPAATAPSKCKAFDRVRKGLVKKKYLRVDDTYYYLLNLEDVESTSGNQENENDY